MPNHVMLKVWANTDSGCVVTFRRTISEIGDAAEGGTLNEIRIIVNRMLIDRNSSQPYGKLYRYVEEMEDLGYDMAWCGHHRFSDKTAFGGNTASEPSSPLLFLAPLMARTTRMEFATNIMLVPSRHPLELAEEINTLQEISNNRFILGAGIGYKPNEFENCGWNFKSRASRMEEFIAVLRLALTGKFFLFHGKHFQIDEVMISPGPIGGKTTPIWIGAVSEPAMQRAARIADGWEASFADHMLDLADKVKRYRAMAAEHGRPSTLALMRDVHVVPSRDRIDPNFLKNVIKVWQDYGDLGAMPDRDEEFERGRVRESR